MAQINRWVFITGLLLTLVGCWNRNRLPANIELLPQLSSPPLQQPTRRDHFSTEIAEHRYDIRPQYEYDLTGLVVSYRHHDGNRALHKRWNDHLNMLDICVVWGETAASGVLDRLSFWNGRFTCNVKTSDRDAWSRFDMTELSNNHLLSDQRSIRSAVKQLNVGDQIRVRGVLASYTTNGGAERGTSTTRTDTGDGACETIYVEQFEILDAGSSSWRVSMWTGLLLILATIIVHFAAPFQPD